VRSTHFLVSIDPVTGATRLTVVAGVVYVQPTGKVEGKEVKPGETALVVKAGDRGEVIIAPADLDFLMRQSDGAIVEAIVAAAAEIVVENEAKMERYLEGVNEAAELARLRSNIESLLGAIVNIAIKNGVITEQRAKELIAEAERRTGVTVDLSKNTLTLTDEERTKQAEQKRRQEELERQAQETRQAKEEERRRNEPLIRALEQARLAKQEANRLAEEERRKNAEETYLAQLSEEERQRFEQDRSLLAGGSGPAPAGTGGSSGGKPNQPLQAPYVELLAVRDALEMAFLGPVGFDRKDPDYDFIYTYRAIVAADQTAAELIVDFASAVEDAETYLITSDYKTGVLNEQSAIPQSAASPITLCWIRHTSFCR